MTSRNDRPTRPAGAVPRWAAGLLALQSLTLAGVMASRPAASPADAAPRGSLFERDDGLDDGRRGDPPPVLPNAAAQRREQALLLARIADSIDRTNERLAALQKQLSEGTVRVDAAPVPAEGGRP